MHLHTILETEKSGVHCPYIVAERKIDWDSMFDLWGGDHVKLAGFIGFNN